MPCSGSLTHVLEVKVNAEANSIYLEHEQDSSPV